jgi:hypothetical protein
MAAIDQSDHELKHVMITILVRYRRLIWDKNTHVTSALLLTPRYIGWMEAAILKVAAVDSSVDYKSRIQSFDLVSRRTNLRP